MKKNVAVSFFSLALVSTAGAAHIIKYNPQFGNDRIIFSAQHKRGDAFLEGINAGGSVLGAERQCLQDKVHYEKNYGEGVCERIREFVPGETSREMFAINAFWYAAVPAVIVGSILAGVGLFAAHKKFKKE